MAQKIIEIKSVKNNSENVMSVITSFAVENLAPSKEVLEYCKMRDLGKKTYSEEVEFLKKKYMKMASK